MPLPICALPRRPQSRPISTFWSSYALIQAVLAHLVLADHRPGLHRGVDLVAGAVEEAGVDEHHAVAAPRAMHALRLAEVRRSSSMMPIFSVLRGRPSSSSTRPNSVVGERHFLRPVHLRLDDVDRARRGCCAAARCSQVVHRDQRGDRRIQDALGDLAAVGVQHRVGVHVVADIADQHQAAARQASASPPSRRRCRRGPGVQPAGQRLAALLERVGQRALHQAEPVAIGQRPCRRHPPRRSKSSQSRIVVIADSSTTSATPAGSSLPIGWPRSITHFDVQAVVAQQHGRRRRGVAAIADELRRIRQPGRARRPSASRPARRRRSA